MIYLDTMTVVRLVTSPNLLSRRAKQLINRPEVFVSPMVVLELQFLYEIQRIKYSSDAIMRHVESHFGVAICQKPFVSIATKALELSWTHDLFDRVILAHAALDRNHLVTKDESMRSRYKYAVW